MNLVYVEEVYHEETVDMLDLLRRNGVGRLVAPGEKYEELEEIKNDLLNADESLRRLVEMKPSLRLRYVEMHRQACEQLEKRIWKLNIEGVRREK
jgi:hypothetical protein